ncbi:MULTISPECIES: phosphoribosylformylglycinamidine cyclo-ligase [Fusobacterium]|uniref:phosphoribosylformylglycinamidine cyclo-ligase n=1 Tax=Fusobacterium TaxID=848 RepID=UPI001F15D622|nr:MULTISPECIES: phosphoribosylformylglycinamidine cyclo-ligase [Fusobacterium]MDY2980100.1 phosphoribosylformylglycinamidine cyclo-ligase [Fusobacterium sp.]
MSKEYMENNMSSQKYMESGVNLEAGYESVRRIKSHVARTKVKGVIDSIGAFGGMFDLSALGYKEPVLISGTDGVGTKLMLAFKMDKHDTIGQDVVAMCVNDVLVQGAMPIFFLDYVAVGKNFPEQIEQIVKGVADGCELSECGLIGGETAEMPDMYEVGDYDLAGFCVGVVEKSKLITGEKVKKGNKVIGLPSTGVHSNGFSLVRKIVMKDNNLDLNGYRDVFDGKSLGEALLTPTRIYVKTIKRLLEQVEVNGMCHITGGGFYENVPRIIPQGLCAKLDTKAIDTPKIFNFLQEVGQVPKEEMYNVFNMGIGFMIIVDEDKADKTMEVLKSLGEKPVLLGEVVEGEEGVDLVW